MKKIYIGLLAAGLLTMAACSNDEFESVQVDDGVKTLSSFTATLADNADTRVAIVNDNSQLSKNFAWQEFDDVGVHSDLIIEPEWYHMTQSDGYSATFEGNIVSGHDFYVVKADNGYEIDPEHPNLIHYYSYANEASYDANNYWVGVPLVGKLEYNNFALKATMGFVHIAIGGMNTIWSVDMMGNRNEHLGGQGTIDISAQDPEFVLDGVWDSDESEIVKSAWWSYEEQQDMTEGKTKDIYFALPVMTLESGFTITISGYDTSGEYVQFVKRTTNPLQIQARRVYNYTLVDVSAELEEQRQAREALEAKEKEMLLVMYNQMSGLEDLSQVEYPESWDLNNPLESWAGVWVDDEGYITELEINYTPNPMYGTIPSTIAEFPRLRRLSLQNLGLTGYIPSEIGSLSMLEDLTLLNNRLKGSIPEEFVNLTNLQYLDLSWNCMDFELSDELNAWLQGLDWYDLDGQRMENNSSAESYVIIPGQW